MSRHVTPTELATLVAAIAVIAARKRTVPVESHWLGLRDRIAALPGVGPARLEAARQQFFAAVNSATNNLRK